MTVKIRRKQHTVDALSWLERDGHWDVTSLDCHGRRSALVVFVGQPILTRPGLHREVDQKLAAFRGTLDTHHSVLQECLRISLPLRNDVVLLTVRICLV